MTSAASGPVCARAPPCLLQGQWTGQAHRFLVGASGSGAVARWKCARRTHVGSGTSIRCTLLVWPWHSVEERYTRCRAHACIGAKLHTRPFTSTTISSSAFIHPSPWPGLSMRSGILPSPLSHYTSARFKLASRSLSYLQCIPDPAPVGNSVHPQR